MPPIAQASLLAVATAAALHKLWQVQRQLSPGRRGTGQRAEAPATAFAVDSTPALEDEPSLVDLGALDCACPQRFYLPDPAFENLADCFAMVDGVRLPLHNQLLAAQAAVLRELFVAQVEGGNKVADSSSSSQVACFLRLVYSPDHATVGSLQAVHRFQGGLLAAVAGLAHRLDAGSLLAKIEAYLQGASSAATIPELLGTVQLAEACHLAALADTCLGLLACKLAAAGPFWHEQVDTQHLAECNSDSLASLACKMAGSVHAGAFEPPAVHGLQRGQRGAAGGFTWVIKHFSKQQGRITSPWVEVGGVEWRLKVWPRGDDAAGGTHLSAYLECNYTQAVSGGLASVEAHYEFSFLDQSEEGLHYNVDCGKDLFTATTQNWGKTRMMPLKELARTDRAYLTGDRLAVRISIRVVPPLPLLPDELLGGF